MDKQTVQAHIDMLREDIRVANMEYDVGTVYRITDLQAFATEIVAEARAERHQEK